MKLVKSFETLSASRVEVDPVEALLAYQDASIALDEAIEKIQGAVQSFETYSEIVNCIEKCGGVSKSLEILFGENFSSAAGMKEEASKEVFEWAETAWKWCVEFFQKLWNWIRSLFTNGVTVKEKLNELKGRDNVEFPIELTSAWGLAGAVKAKEILDNYVKFIEECKLAADAAQDTPGKGNALDAKAEELLKKCEEAGQAKAEGEVINDKAALVAYIDKIIENIDSVKGAEENFKKSQKDIEEIVKKIGADANKKGAFIKVQKVTGNVGKVFKKFADAYVRQGQMLLSAVKKGKAAPAAKPAEPTAPAAEPAKPEEKK